MSSAQRYTQWDGGGFRTAKPPRRKALLRWGVGAILVSVVILGLSAWLGAKANAIRSELSAATDLLPSLKNDIQSGRTGAADTTIQKIQTHTAAARKDAGDPVWKLASAVPIFGANFSAVTEVSQSADDVVNLSLAPLAHVFKSLNWNSLVPSSSGADLASLQQAAPSVSSAAQALKFSAERLERIDASALLPEVAAPLVSAREQLEEVTGALDSAADVATIAPEMLGADGARNYLLIIQNNAEARASGGIPGAVAVLGVEGGRLSLVDQSSASEVGIMDPVLPVEPEQLAIYTSRLGKFMQDANLTPDFPTAASTVQSMWERKTGQRVDGVISIDPVALSFILEATGPVRLDYPDLSRAIGLGLPSELSGQNVVSTLLSDVYARIPEPKLQDAYFAAVAQEIFGALSNGSDQDERLIAGVTRGTQEGRILMWSTLKNEQSIIAKYPLSGSISGPSVPASQFGLYLNDGTGAKMDYYVERTVQLIKECPRDGYEQTTVRVTSTNTAPGDAATVLPRYVTGGGIFGVPAGSVQTNLVAYGPVQAQVEMVKLDGRKTEFAPYIHSNRPVGVLTIRLAPGESRTVDFTFGKIPQHTEPNLFVTPTIQDVKDVTLPTVEAACD